MKRVLRGLTRIFILSTLIACGGGSSNQGDDGGCDGSCLHQSLSRLEVRIALQRGVAAAKKIGVSATFALTDRVGNVLAVYQMPGATQQSLIDGQIGAVGGLEGKQVPATLAAISKAGTGAYLSSQGQAFSTRTAGLIIQEHFYPGERLQGGGPLFGVQFSQLPCSDILKSSQGLRPLPLGLSADPGGLPLYKAGDVVGGIGVELDGKYTLDRNVFDLDQDNLEEQIATAAAQDLEAPINRRADKIIVGGKGLLYSDVKEALIEKGELEPLDESGLIPVNEFFAGEIKDGALFGERSSGILNSARAGVPAAILASQGVASRDGISLEGQRQLKSFEVDALLDAALITAQRTRGAIRNPLDSPARVSIWVVDNFGNRLGFVRSQDAPVFGIDVALQKARSAAFFSSGDAGSKLQQAGLGTYVRATEQFVSYSDMSSNSQAGRVLSGIAFSNRGIGNLARPFFIDGVDGNPNGPLSLPFPGAGERASLGSWSPFNTGLQLDLIQESLLAPLTRGVIPAVCASSPVGSRLGNGMQIFPGSVPLYRDGGLIGAIGVSGDGIDQDDLIAFYGASRSGLNYAGHTDVGDPILGFNAPIHLRSDQLSGPFSDSRLRYVNCPEAPFIGENEQNVCND